MDNLQFSKITDKKFIDKKNSLLLEKSLHQKHFSSKSLHIKPLQDNIIKDIKNLILNEIKSGIYEFYQEDYFLLNDSFFKPENFTTHKFKKLLDFLKCNILYEDIPLYQEKYEALIEYIKDFLYRFYFIDINVIVSFTYSRYLIFSIIDFYKSKNMNLIFNMEKNIFRKKNTNEYLLFFCHHRTQNSLLGLLISEENFEFLYKISKDSESFNIISNVFSGILKFELIENKSEKNKKYFIGYKVFYEDLDINFLIKEDFKGNFGDYFTVEEDKINNLDEGNCCNFKGNNFFLDVELFEKYISYLEEEFQLINFENLNISKN